MSAPLDELYFNWLYSQVGDPEIKNPTRTYWRMLKLLFTKEFVWIVPNDDNRIEDGKDLRYEFIDQSGLADVDLHWMNMGCSMFELIVGLSRRLAFMVDGKPRDCFWVLIENVELRQFNDSNRFHDGEVEDILDSIIWRTYKPNGHGGLFPLQEAHEDQRDVELWYQLSAYVVERM